MSEASETEAPVQITREALVAAARDLNKVLDLDPPGIDPESSQDNIRDLMVEAVKGNLVHTDDKIADETRAVLFALTEDPIVAPKAPKVTKFKEPKEPKPGKTEETKAKRTLSPEHLAAMAAGRAAKSAGEPNKPKVVKTSNKSKAAKPKEPKQSSRGVGKPAKSADEFRQLGANTMRGKIFSRMDGTRTVSEIATDLGITPSNAGGYIHGIWRDCGIGFSYDSNKHITASLPDGVVSVFHE
jgi:hypothetical protein